jgi:DNA helicase-2/ATP-dependent DNA helicase PcrA
MGQGDHPAHAGAFTARATMALTDFGRMFHAWLEQRDNLPLMTLIDRVLADTDYRRFVDDGTEEGADRWSNLMELRGLAEEFAQVGLTSFLEHVALISDQDTLTDALNAPTLLTLHAAKGLEFPVVFIVGLDDGVLPHQRSFEDPEAMAEERRLFYVGITRAIDRLVLVRAFRRRQSGPSTLTKPSRFLKDIPVDLIEGDLPGRQTRAEALFQRQTRWGRGAPLVAEARYRAGMRVRHPTFGEGVVMETRLERDDEEVTVMFEDVGVKLLAASLAQLEVLEGE